MTLALDALLDPDNPAPTAEAARIRVDVADPILLRALRHLLAEHPAQAGRPIVIGDEHAAGPLDVLVVTPTPVACQVAMQRAITGEVSAVLTTDTLEELPAVVATAGESIQISRRVLTLANQMPPFSPRDLEILRALLGDRSTVQIARGLGISEATVKRSLTALMTLAGVSSKAGLVARAVTLGLRPGGLR